MIFGLVAAAAAAKEICLGLFESRDVDPPFGVSIHGSSTSKVGVSIARCFPLDFGASSGVLLLSEARARWGVVILPGG